MMSDSRHKSKSRVSRFTFGTELILKEGGWFDGRKGFFHPPSFPDMPDWNSFPLVESILDEFSGLSIGQVGKGVERDSHRIDFNPKFPWSFYDHGERYKTTYGKLLYPLGEMGAPYLFMDEEGFVVIHYFLIDEMAFIGCGFDNVLEMLLLGFGGSYTPCPLK